MTYKEYVETTGNNRKWRWVKLTCPNCHKSFRQKIWVDKESYLSWGHTHCTRCGEKVRLDQLVSLTKEKEMKYGKIYDYRSREEAKAFIGKKGVFNDYLKEIYEDPDAYEPEELVNIEEHSQIPYNKHNGHSYQFFRPLIEEPQLMTNRQLSEWIAKGYGECSDDDGTYISAHHYYDAFSEDKPVLKNILIRRWHSDEWILPTVEVYEEDCR